MNGKILIVDDEKNIRTTLSTSFVSLGYEVDSASNGGEALEKLKENRYSLVLLDIKMHGMTGMEVLSKMRDRGDNTDVIMMTAYGTIGNAVEAMKLGAVDFITKPFTLENIKTTVSDVIKRQGLKEAEIKTYSELVQFAKKCIVEKDFEKAKNYLKKAIIENIQAPEPHNLLGVISEYEGDLASARKYYRVALDFDPAYKPSLDNLERITSFKYTIEGIKFEQEKENKNSKK
jgi:FixJ family two-component response regulator